MVFVKPHQILELMLNVHMLVRGDTAALLWQIMNEIHRFKSFPSQAGEISLLFGSDQYWSSVGSICSSFKHKSFQARVNHRDAIVEHQMSSIMRSMHRQLPVLIRSQRNGSVSSLFISHRMDTDPCVYVCSNHASVALGVCE